MGQNDLILATFFCDGTDLRRSPPEILPFLGKEKKMTRMKMTKMMMKMRMKILNDDYLVPS